MSGGRELVGYALLNQMPPGARALARPHLSSDLEGLLDRLSHGEAAEEDDSGSGPEGGGERLLDGLDAEPPEVAELGLGEGVVDRRETQAEGQ